MKYSSYFCLSLIGLSILTSSVLAADENAFLEQVRQPAEQTLGYGHSAIWTMPLVATQYQPANPTPAMQTALQAQSEARFLDALIVLENENKNVQAGSEAATELNLLHASFLLQGNQSKQAITLLAPLLTNPKYTADAYALSAMAYLQQGKSQQALEAANHAHDAQGEVLPHLVLTYALQGTGRLEEARNQIHDFNSHTPSPITLAREAELALTLNQTATADTLISRAQQMDASQSYVVAVSGLTYLIDGKVAQAKSSFETALKRDPKDAKALFGLGLAEIKLGKYQAGIYDLQTANESDPGNALILTYLGRVQQQLGQTVAATESWRSAEQADPKDPVPYLYQAQAALQANQPLQARDYLLEAQARKTNRGVYRGDQLLQEDNEILQANVAEVQRQLGLDSLAFQTLSDTTGEKSSANLRNQADVLQGQRFGESARRSLLLQSLFNDKPGNLLSSMDIYGDSAGQTGASFPQHGVISDLKTSQVSLNNYDSLFTQRATLAFDATTGSQNSNGEEVRLGAGNDTLGISLAGLQFKTDGFDYQNTYYAIPLGLVHQSLDNSVAQGVVQWRPTQTTQVFVSYQSYQSNHGETQSPADPYGNGFFYQNQDTSGIVRVGLRQTLDDSSELRGIYSHQQTSQVENKGLLSDFLPPTDPFYTGPAGTNSSVWNNSSEASSGELQYRRSGAGYATQWGGIWARAGLDQQQYGPYTNIAQQVYVNWQQTLNPYWQLEAGLAWGENDQITLSTDPSTNVTTDTSSLEHDWLPKLGLIYTPDNSTHVRLAGWKGMDSEAVGDASLAPATLAGFMLNRTSDNYKLVRGVALGADKQLGAAWFLEGRVQRRWTDSPLNNGFATRFIPRLTDESRLALHWQPENQPLNFTLAYDDELFQLGDLRSFETNSVQEQHLRATQLDFRWFVNSQLTANFGLSHNQLDAIQQQTLCDLLAVSCSGIIVPFDVSQSFNNADASVSWKLNQHGSVDAGVRNAANTGILYTELDPLIPRFSQGRQVYAKVKLTW